MSEKHHNPQPTTGRKAAGGHGAFKHSTKGTTLDAVLGAYKLSQSDLKRVRHLVTGKEPLHAR